jgi:hypothetical protein
VGLAVSLAEGREQERRDRRVGDAFEVALAVCMHAASEKDETGRLHEEQGGGRLHSTKVARHDEHGGLPVVEDDTHARATGDDGGLRKRGVASEEGFLREPSQFVDALVRLAKGALLPKPVAMHPVEVARGERQPKLVHRIRYCRGPHIVDGAVADKGDAALARLHMAE